LFAGEDPDVTRKVEFVVVSETLSATALCEVIGTSPNASQHGSPRFPNQATWKLQDMCGPDDDLSSLVKGVLARVQPARGAIAHLRDRDPDVTCVLRITQYVSEDDEVGPGFALEAEDLQLLTDLRAFLDVDQYFV
jgi:hypothetical protein